MEIDTPVLKKELEETGLFQVDVVTAPAPGADSSGFNPRFGDFPAVVMNYDAAAGFVEICVRNVRP